MIRASEFNTDLPLEMSQQEICAIDDFMNRGNFGRLFVQKCRVEPRNNLSGHGPVVVPGGSGYLRSKLQGNP